MSIECLYNSEHVIIFVIEPVFETELKNMQLTTSTYSLHSILINLVTKVEQIVLCLSLYQEKCSLSIMYLLA